MTTQRHMPNHLQRRLLACVIAGCATLPAQAEAPTTPAARVDEQAVHVDKAGGHFTVDLVMHAPVPPAQAWAVLTDFEHMAAFVPNLQSSEVVARSEGLLKVSQKGVARFGIFSSHFESLREIRLLPPREIRAHGVGGSLKQMDSLMQLDAEPDGTRLHYHAELEPGAWFPPLIGASLVQHETAEQFSAMLQEMVRRH
jgi:carbon monoxide dehydrogenase subunit G